MYMLQLHVFGNTLKSLCNCVTHNTVVYINALNTQADIANIHAKMEDVLKSNQSSD